MNPPPLPKGLGRPWWLIPAGAAILIAPATWVMGALALALIARTAVRFTRRWQSRRLEAKLDRSVGGDAGTFVLGADASGRSVALSDHEIAAHGLILGASGSGKSTTLLRILTEQIRQGRPVVTVDLKGSPTFAQELRGAAEAAGRSWRCWTPDGPDTWNPLAAGNATELKDKLIATERFTEPHYQRAAERYVQTALQVMQESDPSEAVTLAGVVRMLEPARLAAAARGLPAARAEHVRDYLASLTPDQLSAVRGLASRLAIISESHAGQYLSSKEGASIDLRAALRGDEVVLFSLNSSSYGQFAAQLGTLVVQDLVSAAGHRLDKGETRSAIVGIDEFSALGSDNLLSLLSRGRESGVSVVLATQELADLNRAARGLRDQILGNTAVKIAHRQEVPESAETVARLAGTVKEWERSYQVRSGRFGGADVSRGTLRLVDRLTVDPGQVSTFQAGEALVIVKTPRSSARVVRVTPPRERNGPER